MLTMGRVTRKRASTNTNITTQNKTVPKEKVGSKAKNNRSKSNKNVKSKTQRKASLVSNAEPEEQMEIKDNESVFYGYDDEVSYLKQLMQTLLRQNKANSVILCGDAGFGKNHLVEACLSSYPVVRGQPDPEYGHLNVELFELDGNLHGKNDLATLRLIGRRLNHWLEKAPQVMVEDESEAELDDNDLPSKVANSIPKIIEQFHFLIEQCPNFRCVIILDNFEVFSYRQQHLLYNLFDLIQQGHSVLIIGLTRRLDCIQLLTSRVQSRLNRRMIHLVAPFKTLESYSKFCSNYLKYINSDDPNVCLRIDQNLFQKDIEKTFSINRSFNELKRLIQLHSFLPRAELTCQPSNERSKSASIFLFKDPKIVELSNLTKSELVLLIIATRRLKSLDTETFSCKQLHEWAIQVQSIKGIRFEQVVKCIYKMIELDLLIVAKETRSQSSKTAQLWITPWTTLMLNISQFQLNQLIEGLGSSIPAYIKQLLS